MLRKLSGIPIFRYSDIPVKILKENAKFFAEQICRQFNDATCSSKFPATFKFANVTPVLKQDNKNLKGNYRPISILQAHM